MAVVISIVVIGDRVSDQPGGGGSRHGDGRINRLHRTACGIIGGHATQAGNGKPRESDPSEKND
jgi:hypothetical protein